MSSPGRSSMISASHSRIWPVGVRAIQRERFASFTCTASMKAMNRGAFSSRRKNA